MYPFAYHTPATVDEALELLRTRAEARFIAGGMSLLPAMKLRLAAPGDLIDLTRIAGLAGIARVDGALRIGATTRHADVADAPLVAECLPALAGLAAGIGDAQVRNRGTLGGALANNDPAADYPAAVLALGATVTTSERDIAADDFFTGMFETALAEHEMILACSFPCPRRAAYAKLPNPASRYATVGVMVADFDGTVRVAVTGAGPCVFRVPAMEQALEGRFEPAVLDPITLDAAALNNDIHASAEYRARLVTVMAKRAVVAAL